jgi:poly(A) polymerase
MHPAADKPDRALDALERAAVVAERGVAPPLAQSPTSADFAAALKLAPSTLRAPLDRIVMGNDPEAGLDALLESGALDALFPEVHAMVGFGDGEWRHKDVWKHTKQVVRQAVPRLEVRWAALFHDIGKVKTRSITPDGKVHFLGHAEVGTRMFDKLDRRIALFSPEPALKDTVRYLILHHLRANQYDPGWTDSAVRRFARELGAHLDDLLCLARADITTKRPEKKRKGLSQIEELAQRITRLAAEDAKLPPLPSGVGNAVMEAFGLKPSRQIGEIKKVLEEAIEKEEIEARLPCEAYVAFVAANRGRFGL